MIRANNSHAVQDTKRFRRSRVLTISLILLALFGRLVVLITQAPSGDPNGGGGSNDLAIVLSGLASTGVLVGLVYLYWAIRLRRRLSRLRIRYPQAVFFDAHHQEGFNGA
jgi:hypothetical protein